MQLTNKKDHDIIKITTLYSPTFPRGNGACYHGSRVMRNYPTKRPPLRRRLRTQLPPGADGKECGEHQIVAGEQQPPIVPSTLSLKSAKCADGLIRSSPKKAPFAEGNL